MISWLKVKSVKNGTLPEEVLTEEDIKALVGVAYTSRDKGFIFSLYESGCRIGEFLPMAQKQQKHYNFHDAHIHNHIFPASLLFSKSSFDTTHDEPLLHSINLFQIAALESS